jgi:hypothetical protein
LDAALARSLLRWSFSRQSSSRSLAHQQRLRAAIDWSYALLSEPERSCFRRLAVFAGGFTLGAAEEVAGEPGQFGDGPASTNDARLRARAAALPASPETILCYVVDLVDRYTVATIDRRLSSIGYYHKQARHGLPTKDAEVERAMRGIRGAARRAARPQQRHRDGALQLQNV